MSNLKVDYYRLEDSVSTLSSSKNESTASKADATTPRACGGTTR